MKSCRSDIERLVPVLRQVARALVESHRADVADDLVQDALDEVIREERSWSSAEVETRLFTRLIAANRLRLRAEADERARRRGIRRAPTTGRCVPPPRRRGSMRWGSSRCRLGIGRPSSWSCSDGSSMGASRRCSACRSAPWWPGCRTRVTPGLQPMVAPGGDAGPRVHISDWSRAEGAMKRMQRVFGDLDALRFVDGRLDEERRAAFQAISPIIPRRPNGSLSGAGRTTRSGQPSQGSPWSPCRLPCGSASWRRPRAPALAPPARVAGA